MNASLLKKILLPMFFALIALTVQGALLRYLLPEFAVPNLVLILVVFFGFFEVTPLGAFIAFLIGIEADLVSGVLIGPSAGAFSVTFGVLAALSTRVFVESGVAVAVAVFLASLLSNSVYLLLVFQFSPAIGRSLPTIFAEAFTTSVVAPLLFILLKKLLIPRRDRPATRVATRSRPRMTSS